MTIQEIKQRLTIVQVLAHYGIEIGRNNMIACPFHEDKKPSMKVYPDTNTVYCFAGSCEVESLDVIDFIMLSEAKSRHQAGQMTKISKHEAILKAKSLITGTNYTPSKPTSIMKSPTTPNPNKSDLLTDFFTYCQKSLCHAQAKAAKAYKAERGLNGAVAMGYNSGKYHHHKSAETVEKLVEIGLLKPAEAGYRIWANGCLVFALRDKAGAVRSVYGRSIFGDGHFYMKGREGLFPKYPDPKIKYLILTESIIDAATLMEIALPLENYAVLALYGTQGLTAEHRRAIKEWVFPFEGEMSAGQRGKEIIFALDGDGSGRAATQKHALALQKQHPSIRFSTLVLPDGEDVNSMYVAHSEKEELFKTLFLERQNIVEKEVPKASPKIIPSKPVASTSAVPSKAPKLHTSDPQLLRFETIIGLVMYIMGGIKLEGLDRLRVTLKLHFGRKTFRDSLDLYSAMQVEKLVKRAASRLDMSYKLLLEQMDLLTEHLEEHRLKQLQSIAEKQQRAKRKVLTDAEKTEGLAYLNDPNLLQQTGEDIGKSGVVGEQINRLVLYLIYLSRKMQKPLHSIIFGKSGSGKTHLQSGVAALVPDEDKLETTTLSDNAVYYFGENEISHFLIIIEDMDGAEGVLLALRELQSKREVRKTVTIKDDKGQMKTVTLVVRGPICLSACTTRDRLYEDNANRSFLLYVDESGEQDERIMAQQRRQSAGKINTFEQSQLQDLLQNTQRLLKPIHVVNPYAEYIHLPKSVFKPRRTNAHVLHFIEAITFYHQYQREVKLDPDTQQRYIESTVTDIEWAFKLLRPILLRKSDELSGACRSFFESIKKHLKSEGKTTFYQKEIRELLRINPNNLKYYLNELTRFGLLQISGGNRYRGGYEYEVLDMDDYSVLEEKIAGCFAQILVKIKAIASKKQDKNG